MKDNLYKLSQDIHIQSLEEEVQQLKDKVINRQTHINTLRQDLNKAQNKLHRRNMQIENLKKKYFATKEGQEELGKALKQAYK